MNARVVSYDDMRRDVAGVVDAVYSGGTVLLQEANKPVAAIISFEDYVALQQQLEDLHDARIADAAYERYLADPSSAISWEEAKDILRADGLLDEQ